MRRRLASVCTLAGLVAFVVAACSSPTVTPPPVTNTPPTIASLTIGTRAEADQPIQIAATVTDVETPIAQLTYTWSASPHPGIFGGAVSFSGNQVINTWRPPKGEKTPD